MNALDDFLSKVSGWTLEYEEVYLKDCSSMEEGYGVFQRIGQLNAKSPPRSPLLNMIWYNVGS